MSINITTQRKKTNVQKYVQGINNSKGVLEQIENKPDSSEGNSPVGAIKTGSKQIDLGAPIRAINFNYTAVWRTNECLRHIGFSLSGWRWTFLLCNRDACSSQKWLMDTYMESG